MPTSQVCARHALPRLALPKKEASAQMALQWHCNGDPGAGIVVTFDNGDFCEVVKRPRRTVVEVRCGDYTHTEEITEGQGTRALRAWHMGDLQATPPPPPGCRPARVHLHREANTPRRMSCTPVRAGARFRIGRERQGGGREEEMAACLTPISPPPPPLQVWFRAATAHGHHWLQAIGPTAGRPRQVSWPAANGCPAVCSWRWLLFCFRCP
jgi:hypothetical protein